MGATNIAVRCPKCNEQFYVTIPSNHEFKKLQLNSSGWSKENHTKYYCPECEKTVYAIHAA